MRFLQKINPQATRESAIMHAVGGGLIGALVAIGVCYTSEDFPGFMACVMVPWMALGGALIGFAMHWQLPPDY